MIGLEPSRGAYLLSSSSTTNCNGRATPAAFLALERLAQHDADDEALGAVVEVVDVDDGHLVRSKSTRLASAARCRDVGADERLEVADATRAAGATNALTVPAPMARPPQKSAAVLVGIERGRR